MSVQAVPVTVQPLSVDPAQIVTIDVTDRYTGGAYVARIPDFGATAILFGLSIGVIGVLASSLQSPRRY